MHFSGKIAETCTITAVLWAGLVEVVRCDLPFSQPTPSGTPEVNQTEKNTSYPVPMKAKVPGTSSRKNAKSSPPMVASARETFPLLDASAAAWECRAARTQHNQDTKHATFCLSRRRETKHGERQRGKEVGKKERASSVNSELPTNQPNLSRQEIRDALEPLEPSVCSYHEEAEVHTPHFPSSPRHRATDHTRPQVLRGS